MKERQVDPETPRVPKRDIYTYKHTISKLYYAIKCLALRRSAMTQRTLEDTGSNPRAGGKKRTTKKHHKYSSPPAHPSVKRVPGLVLGEQSTPTVSHCTTNGSGGTTGCPHQQWEAWLVPPASSLPGLQECS